MTALALVAQCHSMDEFLRRLWRQSWAPFALIALGAVIVWLIGYDFTDSVPIILVVVLICLLAAGISSRIERTGRRPGKPDRRTWH